MADQGTGRQGTGRTVGRVLLGAVASLLLFVVVAAVFSVLGQSCTSSPCSTSSTESPEPALECPGGDLCYRGQCVKACNAGQELVTECSDDGDCAAPRANCVRGFCSTCSAGESCLPSLNICEAVSAVDLPDAAPRPSLEGRVLPAGPLEDVEIGGGLVFPLDAGTQVTVKDVTHLVYIDLGRTVQARTQAEATVLSVNTLDVSSSTVPDALRRANYRIETQGATTVLRSEVEADRVDSGDCSLVHYGVYRGLPSADLGKVILRSADGYSSSMSAVVEFNWDIASGKYLVTAPLNLPNPLFTWSTVDVHQYVALTGAGKTGVLDAWPTGSEDSYRKFLVYAMDLDDATRALLSAPIALQATQPNEIALTWNRGPSTQYPSTWRVVVRVLGDSHDIVCRRVESVQGSTNALHVPSTLLRQFALAEDLAGKSASIEIERSEEVEQLAVGKATNNVRMLHRVRHAVAGLITFQ